MERIATRGRFEHSNISHLGPSGWWRGHRWRWRRCWPARGDAARAVRAAAAAAAAAERTLGGRRGGRRGGGGGGGRMAAAAARAARVLAARDTGGAANPAPWVCRRHRAPLEQVSHIYTHFPPYVTAHSAHFSEFDWILLQPARRGVACCGRSGGGRWSCTSRGIGGCGERGCGGRGVARVCVGRLERRAPPESPRSSSACRSRRSRDTAPADSPASYPELAATAPHELPRGENSHRPLRPPPRSRRRPSPRGARRRLGATRSRRRALGGVARGAGGSRRRSRRSSLRRCCSRSCQVGRRPCGVCATSRSRRWVKSTCVESPECRHVSVYTRIPV